MVQKVDHIGDQVQDMKRCFECDDDSSRPQRCDRLMGRYACSSCHDAVVNKIVDHLVSGDITCSHMFILAPGSMGKI